MKVSVLQKVLTQKFRLAYTRSLPCLRTLTLKEFPSTVPIFEGKNKTAKSTHDPYPINLDNNIRNYLLLIVNF